MYIRGLVYTPDGRSIVDTVGQRRFRVVERGRKDGYDIARVELFQDQLIQQDEFDGLFIYIYERNFDVYLFHLSIRIISNQS